MSDGPHKSLPLKRHWKKLAERAATPSYALSEVAETLPHALYCELKEAPIKSIVDILCGSNQFTLFPENCLDQLEALRNCCRGSIAGTVLIDCAIEVNTDGLSGRAAVDAAVINTLDSIARGFGHSIEEHYKRKKPSSVLDIRSRLKEARSALSYTSLASDIISGNTANIVKSGFTKRTGINEGPPL